MKKIITFVIIISALISLGFKKVDDIKNYYGIPDVLTYNKTDYKLIASYHPNEHYYKQEYIPSGESPDHYNTLLVIDFYITELSSKDMITRKENELDGRKKTDIVTTWEQMENSDLGEYMLDFVISDANGDNLNLVERNIYRYKNYTDKSGNKGVLLLGISQRGYGDGITSFFKALKKSRTDDINKLGLYDMPQIEIQ